MLTKRYMPSVKNLPAILDKIISGTAPAKFTAAHLKNIGLPSSNDRAVIPILKDLGFLASDGTPTKRYHEYRNAAQSRSILGEALKQAYEDVFHVNAKPTKSDREAVVGAFKSVNNVSDRVAELQAMTFFALLDRADLVGEKPKKKDERPEDQQAKPGAAPGSREAGTTIHLRHNIEVHLPATKDVEVYNAIFKALKEHLID
jgi:Family of unknown function (DUF5343)